MLRRLFLLLLLPILYTFWGMLLLISTERGTQLLLTHLPTPLHVDSAEGRLIDHLVLHGISFQDPSLSFTLDRIEIYWHPLALWHKQATVKYLSLTALHIQDTDTPSRFNPLSLPFHWQIKNIFLKNFHYQRNTLHITAEGSATSHWALDFHFYDKNISHLDITSKGRLDITGHLQGTRTSPNITAILNTQALQLQNQWLGNLHTPFSFGLTLAHLPTVQGYFQIDDLNLLKLVVPSIAHPQGRLHLDFENRGTWGKPRWEGRGVLQGAFDIPTLGIHLTALSLAAERDKKGDIVYVGSAHSEGNASLMGNTHFTSHGAQTHLTLQSTHFLVANTPAYKIFTDANLQFSAEKNQLHLQGEVIIPEAYFTPQEKNNSTEMYADDIVYVDENPDSDIHLPLTSNVKIILGNRVSVEYNGMKGLMTGQLALSDMPNQPTTAKGEIALTGTYHAFKQNLTLNNSRLLFTGGPLSDPLLDISATKKILPRLTDISEINSLSDAASQVTQTGEITVGLKIQGPVNHKRVSLFSSPATLSSEDILSYLLFGVPATQVTANNGRFLYSATNLLNLGGGKLGNLSEKFQHFLGLDEINFGSATGVSPLTGLPEETPTLILGKALSPRLYVSYSMGRFQSVNILKVRYFLARHWILLSETNSLINSLDLFYTIERDQ